MKLKRWEWSFGKFCFVYGVITLGPMFAGLIKYDSFLVLQGLLAFATGCLTLAEGSTYGVVEKTENREN